MRADSGLFRDATQERDTQLCVGASTFARHELNEQQDVMDPPNGTHTHYITTIMFGARGRSPRRGEGKTRVVKKPKSTRLNASALCEG